MLTLPASVRILLWSEPVDMRRGINGLSMMVRGSGEDMYSGHLYVFVSRRRDQVRVLTWQRGGFVLLCKRLARGRFGLPADAALGGRLELDAAQLTLLLDGVDLRRVPRPAVWTPRRAVVHERGA